MTATECGSPGRLHPGQNIAVWLVDMLLASDDLRVNRDDLRTQVITGGSRRYTESRRAKRYARGAKSSSSRGNRSRERIRHCLVQLEHAGVARRVDDLIIAEDRERLGRYRQWLLLPQDKL